MAGKSNSYSFEVTKSHRGTLMSISRGVMGLLAGPAERVRHWCSGQQADSAGSVGRQCGCWGGGCSACECGWFVCSDWHFKVAAAGGDGRSGCSGSQGPCAGRTDLAAAGGRHCGGLCGRAASGACRTAQSSVVSGSESPCIPSSALVFCSAGDGGFGAIDGWFESVHYGGLVCG